MQVKWIKGSKKGLKEQMSKEDFDHLEARGWVKALDEPPKDKAIKSAPKKK